MAGGGGMGGREGRAGRGGLLGGPSYSASAGPRLSAARGSRSGAASGVNPMLSIMGLAHKASQYIKTVVV